MSANMKFDIIERIKALHAESQLAQARTDSDLSQERRDGNMRATGHLWSALEYARAAIHHKNHDHLEKAVKQLRLAHLASGDVKVREMLLQLACDCSESFDAVVKLLEQKQEP